MPASLRALTLAFLSLILTHASPAAVPPPTTLTIQPDRPAQAIQGMGCGAIFYEAHITSLAERGRHADQEALYDAMFKDVRTDFLHLMVRHDHEPENDNADPFTMAFKDEWFDYTRHTLAICKAARLRQPDIQLYATLYTPPAWMKTNNDPSGGGESRATLKKGMELEFAEFCMAFLDRMHRNGQTVAWLSLTNEPDWPHTQPGCFFSPDDHARLVASVGNHLAAMRKKNPALPAVKLVAPNCLSAPDAAARYLPPLLKAAGPLTAAVGSHDYDRRGHRWKSLVDAARGRPVWCTEWCVNGPDNSPDLINSATEFWLAMTEAFNDGAHAWMAYDWVYPPRKGGEALIHLDWGERWKPTRIYHGFRQWCQPLQPGMRCVPSKITGPAASAISQPGLKASAFISPDNRTLVIHAAVVSDQPVNLRLIPGSPFNSATTRHWRTSPSESMQPYPDSKPTNGSLSTTLPPRTMATWLLTR